MGYMHICIDRDRGETSRTILSNRTSATYFSRNIRVCTEISLNFSRDVQSSATFVSFLNAIARLVAFIRDAMSGGSRDSALTDSLSFGGP